LLAATPSAVRWASVEPLLEPVDLRLWLGSLDWVVVGGESGRGARPFDIAWARDVLRQCRAAGVPCFIKQLGARPVALRLKHGKGGDMAEWPADLRVREFPAHDSSNPFPTAPPTPFQRGGLYPAALEGPPVGGPNARSVFGVARGVGTATGVRR
jgi:hypothetical protein